MRDNPTEPDASAKADLRRPDPVYVNRSGRLPSGHAAKIARQMAREIEAARGTFPRGDFSPPTDILRALRSDAALRELRRD